MLIRSDFQILGVKMDEYKVGDIVIYGINGVCTVEELKPLDKSGKLYYILMPHNAGKSKIFVPLDNPQLVGRLRRAMTKTQIDEMITASVRSTVCWNDNRSERMALFQSIVHGGISADMIAMVRCIQDRIAELGTGGKRLADCDRNILNLSRALLKEEFAYSLNIEPDEVGSYMREMILHHAPNI